MSLLEKLERLETEFEAANVRVGEATWSVYSGEGEADLDAAQKELARLLTDGGRRALVESALASSHVDGDPLLARRLEIWRRAFLGAAVECAPEIHRLRNRLQERIAGFRFELDGAPIARSELQKILRLDADRDRRRRAWRATAQLAEANRDDLRRLIALRNERARALGYPDFVELVLELQELDSAWLRSMLDEIAAGGGPVYARLVAVLAERAGVPRLAPWDIPFAMRQGMQLDERWFPADEALGRLKSTASALGFPVDRLPIRTLVRDIPFGGYNVAVRIPGDSRFLVNPSEGHPFYATTFHEYGHSLEAVLTETGWPILKEYEWVLGAHTAAYSEGMAEVLGEVVKRPDWLLGAAGVPKAEVERYLHGLLPYQMAARLFELLLAMRVELDAYREIDRMDARERALAAEVRLVDYPDDEPSQWEANTWYATYPVYWQNYILASVVASQVHEALTARFGPEASSDRRVAAYLQEGFYARGNEVPWLERIERGTGKPLSAASYLRRIGMALRLPEVRS